MPSADLLSKGLDRDISAVHRRFVAAMENRLPTMNIESKERYFAVLSALVGKLEIPEKQLRDILQDIMSESASLIFQELGSSR